MRSKNFQHRTNAVFALLASCLIAVAANAQSCSVSGSLAFGDYTPLLTVHADGLGAMQVTCTGLVTNTPIQISMSASGNGAMTPRAFSGAGSTLGYQLYREPSRTSVWGDGAFGQPLSVNLSPANASVRVPVYGRIFKDQFNFNGAVVSDSLTVTLSF